MKLNDRRTEEQLEETTCYVNSTDEYMSGWGQAPDKSFYCIACPSLEVADEVEGRLHQRDEFKKIEISDKYRKGGEGCHCSISWHTSFGWKPENN